MRPLNLKYTHCAFWSEIVNEIQYIVSLMEMKNLHKR